MRNFALFALTISMAAAFLAGRDVLRQAQDDMQLPVAVNRSSTATQARSHQRTFRYTDGEQSFKVPAGVTQATIAATGAEGATGN